MANTMELSKEQFDQLDQIIGGISWKYRDYYGMSRDDLYQEGWCEAIKLIEEKGFQPSLIASAIYCRMKDLMRYNSRRQNQILFDTLPDRTSLDDKPFLESVMRTDIEYYDTYWTGKNRIGNDFDSQVNIKEMDKLFEEGSNDQKFFRLVAVYIGTVKNSEKIQKSIFNFDSSMDYEISLKLGYPNSTSRGYRSVKRRVRKTIAQYMGWGENYNHAC